MVELITPEMIYLATYVALADNRLYDSEWKKIRAIISENNYDNKVYASVLLIIKDLEDKPDFNDCCLTINGYEAERRFVAIKLALGMAFANGRCAGRQENLLMDIKKKIRISNKDYSSARLQVLNESKGNAIAGNIKSDDGSLFSSWKFINNINDMKTISAEDVIYTKSNLDELRKIYSKYPTTIEKQLGTVRKSLVKLTNLEERKAIEQFYDSLIGTIKDMLIAFDERVLELAERQQATDKCYTISFMGRTKAGKSTLHSILLGGDNVDFIGNGSERTTRFNYVYDFHGLRVVDTPGIGAPGGQSDTDIAREIADESDLICYVVTSDSIQETEFDFLKQLKDRNKPVLIILNKKENFMRSQKKRQAFLDNPLGWYEKDGEDSIQGHIDRINTYMTINYDFHNFKIVPVHLLAGKLFLTEEDEEKKQKYKIGSRIDILLQVLADNVSRYGRIQKSQTIYNAAVYHTLQAQKGLELQIKNAETLYEEFENSKKYLLDKLTSIGEKASKELKDAVGVAFDSFINDDVHRFANSHYGLGEKKIQEDWAEMLAENILEKQLSAEYSRTIDGYIENVQDIIQYVEEEMNYRASFDKLTNLKLVDTFDKKMAVDLFGGIVGIVGALLNLSNPGVAVICGVGGLFIEIFGSKMKTKQQRIEDSKEKLFSSLKNNVEKMRQTNIEKMMDDFSKTRNYYETSIVSYYDAILEGISKVVQQISELNEIQYDKVRMLNLAFAERIINFLYATSHYQIGNKDKNDRVEISREYRKFFDIKIRDSAFKVIPKRSTDSELSDLLQEKITCEVC